MLLGEVKAIRAEKCGGASTSGTFTAHSRVSGNEDESPLHPGSMPLVRMIRATSGLRRKAMKALAVPVSAARAEIPAA